MNQSYWKYTGLYFRFVEILGVLFVICRLDQKSNMVSAVAERLTTALCDAGLISARIFFY